MTCDHDWRFMFGTLDWKTVGTGYYCRNCDLTAPVCKLGHHPEGFPEPGRPCAWCAKDTPDKPPQ